MRCLAEKCSRDTRTSAQRQLQEYRETTAKLSCDLQTTHATLEARLYVVGTPREIHDDQEDTNRHSHDKINWSLFHITTNIWEKNCSISSGNRAAYGIPNVVDQFLDISTFSAKFARFCRPQDSCTVAAKLPQERLTTTLQLTCV